MRFRIRTLQVAVAVAAGAIWTLSEGAKAGFLEQVMLIWVGLVAAPVLVMSLILPWMRREAARDQVRALLGAIAIVGYAIAILFAVGAIGFYQP